MQDFLWSPKRGGLDSKWISFPGFPAPRETEQWRVEPGTAEWLNLRPNDVLRLCCDNTTTVAIAAIDEQGRNAVAELGLGGQEITLQSSDFYSADIEQRLRTRKYAVKDLRFSLLSPLNESALLKASTALDAIVVSMATPAQLVEGVEVSTLTVELNRHGESNLDPSLPDPLGDVRDEFTVKRGSARAYQLAKGEYVQVIDVEGRQCSDFMAMNTLSLEQGRERYIDSTVTRTLSGGAYPAPGLFDKFFDQDMKPMLAVVQDTVGRHDTFALACTSRGYEDRGFPGHLNCSDNISHAYSRHGINPRSAWPAINFFFNSWIFPTDNRIQSDEAWSRPGDYVLMRALDDVLCVSTACPDDVDPINGWNPTDIHVRIYKSDASPRRFIAYRASPDSEAIMTKESPFHPRTSELTRHYAVARDYWIPQVFDATGALEEYWACRNAVTIQDMSNLRKLDITGPDAERLLQLCTTRNVSKLAVNRGTYTLLCDERGSVIDDGTLFRLADNVFRWCCGSDDSGLHLAEIAKQKNLTVWIRDLSTSLCNIAVQGPNSRALLAPIIFTRSAQPSFENIKWFGFAVARFRNRDGVPFMVARSGYTGELGYELFCDQSDALEIWDAIVEAGTGHDLRVQGAQALDMLRIEAGLMAAGAEFTDDVDVDEAGLGFAVDMNKGEFIGHDAIQRNRQAARKKLIGLQLDGDEVPHHGNGVFVGQRQIGVITSATRSPLLGSVIAMARVAVEYGDIATKLEVGKLDGHMKRLPGEVVGVPFIDPKREKPRA